MRSSPLMASSAPWLHTMRAVSDTVERRKQGSKGGVAFQCRRHAACSGGRDLLRRIPRPSDHVRPVANQGSIHTHACRHLSNGGRSTHGGVGEWGHLNARLPTHTLEGRSSATPASPQSDKGSCTGGTPGRMEPTTGPSGTARTAGSSSTRLKPTYTPPTAAQTPNTTSNGPPPIQT